MNRILGCLIALMLSCGSVWAQSSYPTPGGSQVDGKIQYCLNPANLAVQCQGGVSAVASFPRPGNTTAYNAGAVEGPSTSSGGAALEFDFSDRGGNAFIGGELVITSVSFEIDVSSIPSGMTSYRLYLYASTPANASYSNLGDGGAWDLASADRPIYTGQYIDLGTPVDVGSTLIVKADGLNAQVTVPAGGKLFGYLVTNGGYTPASATARKITLHGTPL